MDLSQLSPVDQAEEGALLLLRHPITDETLFDEETKEPVSIVLYGADSKIMRDAAHKEATRRLQKSIQKGKLKLDAAELDESAREIDVVAVKSWNHIKVAGNKLTCTPENIRFIYTKWPWIREQVTEYINDRANYLGNSQKAS